MLKFRQTNTIQYTFYFGYIYTSCFNSFTVLTQMYVINMSFSYFLGYWL